MATNKNDGQKPSKKGRKPDQQAKQPLVPHEPDGTPATPDPLFPKFMKAHHAFEGHFHKALWSGKEAGEVALKLEIKSGLKGTTLFATIRDYCREQDIAPPATARASCTCASQAGGTSFCSGPATS